jgi:hypothetical protein
MPQHSIPIFAQAATGTGQLQQGLRLSPLLGRDVTAVQGSLGNTAPAQDANSTLGWAGIGGEAVAGGLRSATLLILCDSSGSLSRNDSSPAHPHALHLPISPSKIIL